MNAGSLARKARSVCGVSFPIAEFSDGNRENRSCCRACDAAVSRAYAKGGAEAARAFRDEARRNWKAPWSASGQKQTVAKVRRPHPQGAK
jgi:hypothetical protein